MKLITGTNRRSGYVPVCEFMCNTLVILTMRFAFVNDGNQPKRVLIILVDLSDNLYNILNMLSDFALKSSV